VHGLQANKHTHQEPLTHAQQLLFAGHACVQALQRTAMHNSIVLTNSPVYAGKLHLSCCASGRSAQLSTVC
jgi:hypothetical protein